MTDDCWCELNVEHGANSAIPIRLFGKRCLMNSDPLILVIGTSPAGACADRDWQKWGIKNSPPSVK